MIDLNRVREKAAARKCEKAAARKSPRDRLLAFLEAAGPDIREMKRLIAAWKRTDQGDAFDRLVSWCVLLGDLRPSEIEIQRLKQVARDVRAELIINERIASLRLRTRGHMSERRLDAGNAIQDAWWVCEEYLSIDWGQ